MSMRDSFRNYDAWKEGQFDTHDHRSPYYTGPVDDPDEDRDPEYDDKAAAEAAAEHRMEDRANREPDDDRDVW